MNTNETIENKKPSRRSRRRWRYILAAIIPPLLLFAVFVFILSTRDLKYDPASEVVIRQAVAYKLNKEPNDLTADDYKNVEELTISPRPFGLFNTTLPLEALELIEFKNQSSLHPRISDIRPLGKLANLKKLYIYDIIPPVNKLPAWLPKWISRHFSGPKDVSISSLGKLKDLQELHIRRIRIRSLKPLAGLKNLKILYILDCPVSDIKPLAKLTNLQEIRFSGRQVSDEQIEELKKKLPNVRIIKVILL